LKGHSLLGCD